MRSRCRLIINCCTKVRVNWVRSDHKVAGYKFGVRAGHHIKYLHVLDPPPLLPLEQKIRSVKLITHHHRASSQRLYGLALVPLHPTSSWAISRVSSCWSSQASLFLVPGPVGHITIYFFLSHDSD